MGKLASLLGLPDSETKQVNRALIATSDSDFAQLSAGELYRSIELIVTCTEPQPLAYLASASCIAGTRLLSLAYISVYRISELIEGCPEQERKDKIGYTSFTNFVEDFVVPDMGLSRTTVLDKVGDIKEWRGVGCSWTVVRDLLAKTPMAGRDAVNLLVKPARKPKTIIEQETGEIIDVEAGPVTVNGKPIAEYLESLTTMGAGEARRDVQERAGLPERFVKEAVYLKSRFRLLIHAVWNNEDVDIVVAPHLDETKLDIEVARWLCRLLGVNMEVR